MPETREYETVDGVSPFGKWLWRLSSPAAVKVTRAVLKLELGLRPGVEAVGQGVFEAKIDFGPGYRVYFGLDGTDVIILLAGGDKRTQANDIENAQDHWADYKARKDRNNRYGSHP